MADVRRPAFQHYPGDEERETGLRLVGLAAFGLWRRMVNLMHEGEPYGHLTSKSGAPIGPGELAKLVGESPAAVRKMLVALERETVFSRTDGGVIYSRRMVRDNHISSVRASAGASGGARSVASRVAGFVAPDLLKQNGEQSTPPSVSSSSSPSTDNPPVAPPSGEPGAKGRRKRATGEPRWRVVPQPFTPTDRHRELAADLGVDFDLELAAFLDHEFEKPKSDADKTFSNWIREAFRRGRSNGRREATVPPSAIDPADLPMY